MKASPGLIRKSINKKGEDFPGDAVYKYLPPNARDIYGFNPWSGMIPQVSEQLSPRAQLVSLHSRAHEQQLPGPAYLAFALHKRSHQNEKPHNEKAYGSNEDPVQSKLNK